MASFAAQLMDMFFVLVERVTGYGGGGGGGGAQDKKLPPEPTTTTPVVSQSEQEVVPAGHNIQVRPRSGMPFVPDGSTTQVN
ncbi:hypothetical protein BS78_06G252400 [Paspalum vaginatum]|nr:hypothetical protein BS78_06G252400 [Paspalum vaginatum]